MAKEASEFRKIEKRAADLADWLKENAPECASEQKHLDEGTEARAYWHYGYLTALRDVVRLMTSESRPTQISGSADTSSSRSAA